MDSNPQDASLPLSSSSGTSFSPDQILQSVNLVDSSLKPASVNETEGSVRVDEAGDDDVKDKLGFVENSLDSNSVVNVKDDLITVTTQGVSVDVDDDDEDEDVLLVGGGDEEESNPNPVVGADDVKVDSVVEAEAEPVDVDVDVSPPSVVTKVDDEFEKSGLDSLVVKAANVVSEGDSVMEAEAEAVDVDVDVSPPSVVTKVNDEFEKSGLDSLVVKAANVVSEGDSVMEAEAEAVDVDADVSPPTVVTKVNDEFEKSGLDSDSLVVKAANVVSEGDSVAEAVDVDVDVLPPLVVSKVDDEIETSDLDSDSLVVKAANVVSKEDSIVEAVDDVDLPSVVTKMGEDGSGDVEVVDKSGLEEIVDKEVVEVEDVEKEVDYTGQENGSVPDDADNSQENGVESSSMVDGQVVTDSDEEEEEEEEEESELFDSSALTALLKAAAGGGSEGGGNITFTSQDGSRLFTVERPAGLGPSLQAMRANPRPQRANLYNPSGSMTVENEPNLTQEERKKLEKLQSIRVKFLRLVHRLGLTPDEPVAAQVLYRLALIAGRQTGQSYSLEAAKQKAMELESDEKNDLDFTVNILVIGKAGAGKSATINSIFGEEKTVVGAFQPATSLVKEIRGTVGGVTFRVFDTPGLRTSVMEQGYNRSVLSSAKKLMKKASADVVLYVDRLDAQTRDRNDIPLLKTITSSLGSAIWRSAIVTLTHGASAPPEGSNGTPLSYETFVTQRSHVVQQAIGQAVGDLRMMSPSLMNPVSLVENHQSCRKNREGQKVLPNGQTWQPQLLMLCYSIKILAEANALTKPTKPQDPYDSRRLFGFRMRSPPLPYMLSSMLQSRAHPKLSADQGGDGGDSDVDLAELTDSDNEDEDEYDQLPPFKPLKRSQLSKLTKEQKKAYFDEYDYRVKLLQKKQWKEEVKRIKEMKKKGATVGLTGQTYPEEQEGGEGDDAPASVAVPLPDMALPPSFDSDNPAYRFRFLEPTSQFLARPVLDTHGWDHDCGYDGVNVEQTLAIANRYPAVVTVQVTKDKKDFSINLDSSVAAKHNEKASSMVGFDIQPIGKQLAYIVRGETKFKNLKRNKTGAGMSVTFLGENIVTGFKVEDQMTLGRQYSIIGSAGTVRFEKDSAYGANIEVQRRELDYPIGQIQSTVGLSVIKWRGDLALGFNSLAQFAAGRNSKVTVRAGLNNKMSGQITVKTSSSEYLSLALAAVIPSVLSAYKKLRPDAGERY